jgi:hypothetical protein
MPKEGDINNPNGKGGFGENPQNRANGRWSKDTSISYWYNHIIRLSVNDFNSFKPETIAQELAYNSVVEAKNELSYLKEVTDRTEGRAMQPTDLTSQGGKINVPTAITVEIVKNEDTSDTSISE